MVRQPLFNFTTLLGIRQAKPAIYHLPSLTSNISATNVSNRTIKDSFEKFSL